MPVPSVSNSARNNNQNRPIPRQPNTRQMPSRPSVSAEPPTYVDDDVATRDEIEADLAPLLDGRFGDTPAEDPTTAPMVEESAADDDERANLPAAENDNPYGGFDGEQSNDEPDIPFEPPRELPRPELRNRRDEVAARLAELPAGDESGPHSVAAAVRTAVEFDLDAAEIFSAVLTHLLSRDADETALDRWRDDDAYRDDLIAAAESEGVRGNALAIANHRLVTITNAKGKEVEIPVPLSMGEVLEQIRRATDDWPRRVGTSLFVPDPAGVHFFSERRGAAALFGWLKGQRDVKWKEGAGYVGQTEVLAELERTAVQYRGIAAMPHEPAIPGIYYSCETPQPGNGERLEEFLNFFRPATDEDRQLLKVAILTCFWGGESGARPAFVITADEGRGAGKTKLTEMIAELCGGFFDVTAGEDIASLKQRLLTPDAQQLRVAVIDNLKSYRFSWAPLESLITATSISGKQMWVGNSERPNLLTWFVTVNGASFDSDLAGRAVIIKIRRGENFSGWTESVRGFIRRHREQLIGDIIAALRAPVTELERPSRWAAWEQAVLCRLPSPGILQSFFLARQAETDVGDDEADLVRQHFERELYELGFRDLVEAVIRVPSAIAGLWLNAALGTRLEKASAGRRLTQMITEGRISFLRRDPGRTRGRSVIWQGPRAVADAEVDNTLRARLDERERQRDRRSGNSI